MLPPYRCLRFVRRALGSRVRVSRSVGACVSVFVERAWKDASNPLWRARLPPAVVDLTVAFDVAYPREAATHLEDLVWNICNVGALAKKTKTFTVKTWQEAAAIYLFTLGGSPITNVPPFVVEKRLRLYPRADQPRRAMTF